MKKRLCSVLLLFLVIPLMAEDWYESGPGGVLRNRIPVGGTQNSAWTVLDEKVNDDTQRQTLYFQDKIQSILTLTRDAGRLLAREERDAQGKLLVRIEYFYDQDGSPRVSYLNTEEDDESGEEYSKVQVELQSPVQFDGGFQRHSSGYGDNWIITDLNPSGQPTRQVTYRDSNPLINETWTRTEDGRLLESLRTEGPMLITRTYDEQGRLVNEQTKRDDYIVLSTQYFWQDSNLVRVEEHGEGRLKVREIQWDGERVSREIHWIDRMISFEIEWTSKTQRTETTYRNAKPIIRVYWSDNRKIREEFLHSGTVKRVRENPR